MEWNSTCMIRWGMKQKKKENKNERGGREWQKLPTGYGDNTTAVLVMEIMSGSKGHSIEHSDGLPR